MKFFIFCFPLPTAKNSIANKINDDDDDDNNNNNNNDDDDDDDDDDMTEFRINSEVISIWTIFRREIHVIR